MLGTNAEHVFLEGAQGVCIFLQLLFASARTCSHVLHQLFTMIHSSFVFPALSLDAGKLVSLLVYCYSEQITLFLCFLNFLQLPVLLLLLLTDPLHKVGYIR